MELGLKGKVAVVTGGTAGIGKASAIAFAKEGCKVAICGRTAQRLEPALEELRAIGGEVFGEQVDVVDCDAMTRFAAHVCDRFGQIDIWFNDAGTNLLKPILDCDLEDWDYIMNTNLRSVFWGSKIAINDMIARKVKGVVINMSSYAATLPATSQPLYGASKVAIKSLTRTFSAEAAPYGIRVLAVAPGWTLTERAAETAGDTDMNLIFSEIAQRRFATAQEVADPVVFLASDRCGYVTGTCMEMDGGKFIVQRPFDPWDRAAEKQE
jgi:NAD(P)-dependent dehydrogenase (short-subunit alcohol dehydrogenase family)